LTLRQPPQPYEDFNSAFEVSSCSVSLSSQEGEVILIGSVGGSKRFQGYAVMKEKVAVAQEGATTSIKKEGGNEMAMTLPFRIEWIKKY
jgi:hypothetical protein